MSKPESPLDFRQYINTHGFWCVVLCFIFTIAFTLYGSPIPALWFWVMYFVGEFVNWKFLTQCSQCGECKMHPNHDYYSTSKLATTYCNWYDAHGISTSRRPYSDATCVHRVGERVQALRMTLRHRRNIHRHVCHSSVAFDREPTDA